ncbi:DUF2948 family protein [Lichenihabitans sp. PAMC28606]|uniref:DUF2948 family protein n=1 Tax=Lichenihabitans sp. PAMC28606 TaxID=2880932 RepID=UPI001D0B2E02|nr:DUF2948 family protein [Lichenihabitans sp. PAMC28606]UDL93877.1 DUF2948 family protein [Lichenihabitans sp. PAMC28606]
MTNRPDATTETATDADEHLRLVVVDADDLAVVSAHMQGADVKIGDMTYLPRTKRFAMVMSRFDWARAIEGPLERCVAGLHFERVLHVSQSGLDRSDADRNERLLAISFIADDAPSGTVLLAFAGGGLVRLTVECLEAETRDMGPRWTVTSRPDTSLPAAISQS